MKPSAKRIIKTISFSLTDQHEAQLLKHSSKHKFFSRYVKRLIQRDMEGGISPSFPKKG